MGSTKPMTVLDVTRLAELRRTRLHWTFLETTPPVGEALLNALKENA